MEFIASNLGIVGGVVAVILLVFFWKFLLWLFGVIIVPDDSIGTVTKKFVIFGSNRNLPDGQIVALNGEAGYQADALPPGLHLGLWPWQYAIDVVKFTMIPQGKIGVVQACDGKPLPSGRIIACDVECSFFQDARAFLLGSGERGPQMKVIPPGTYRINPLLFTVELANALDIPQGKVGVVEAHDGKALPSGRVVAKGIECDSYQDAKNFFAAGGERGPQVKLIPPGNYRVNPILFDVKLADVIDIPENKIGIVTAKEGKSLPTGEIAGGEVPNHNIFQDPDAFIANGGFKGLQEQVLLGGRYFLNPRFATVEIVDMFTVPIANVGVVIAYIGKEGKDVTGDTFQARQSGVPGRKRRVGRSARPRQVSDQPVHAQNRQRAHRQRGAQLGHRQIRGAQSRCESVDHHGAFRRRLQIQSRCVADHSHPAQRCAESHRALR